MSLLSKVIIMSATLFQPVKSLSFLSMSVSSLQSLVWISLRVLDVVFFFVISLSSLTLEVLLESILSFFIYL